jgi:ATP-dependent DNA helicase RecG
MDLDEDQVRAMIADGETLTVEFKEESRRPFNDRSLVETVACLANGDGGYLLIGVADDGSITGARPRHEAGITDPFRLEALIANNTVPPVSAEVGVVTIDGHDVLVIRVDNSARIVGTTSGVYLRRARGGDGRPSCVPFHAHEMLAHEIERGVVDYAALRLPSASWDDLDPLEFERFRRLVREAGPRGDDPLATLTDVETARALGLVELATDNRPLAGALLLFGKSESLRRLIPTHQVAFQVTRGLSVEMNEFFSWPLFRIAEEFIGRFRARNTEEEIQFGLTRIPVPAFPEVAFREALANALIHRDYTARGAVHVQWRDDALEISSPGSFPRGVGIDNLLVTPPNPRNPLLADAFKRSGLVERIGRGIRLMYEAQLRYGRTSPDYGRSTDAFVVAVLPGGPANLALTRYVVQQEHAGHRLSLPELQVLTELLAVRRLTTEEVAHLVQRTEPETRSILNRMVEGGMVEARGAGRSRSYHLAAAVYRALDAAGAYVRVRSFEPFQQEQMVLSYVDAHGQITRKEVAELCALDSTQARTLLQRLVRRGELAMRGEGRTAYYQRAGR